MTSGRRVGGLWSFGVGFDYRNTSWRHVDVGRVRFDCRKACSKPTGVEKVRLVGFKDSVFAR